MRKTGNNRHKPTNQIALVRVVPTIFIALQYRLSGCVK